MKFQIAAAVALFFLPACLDTEEEITVRPDGSCSVRLVAKGHAQDFAEGYPLPCGVEWRVVQADVPEYPGWLRAQVGSAELRSWLPQEKDKQISFELAADFPSLDKLPRFFAPATEAYRSAYLARTSTLKVEPRGAKLLYTFERRFGAREYARFDAWNRMKRALPVDVVRKLDHAEDGQLALAGGELARVTDAAVLGLRGAALAHLEEALLADYTLGNATLPANSAAQIRSAVEQALARVITTQRLRAILDLLCTPLLERQQVGANPGLQLVALENESRSILRKSAREALDNSPASANVKNAIVAQLESSLTAHDQTNDLNDELFRVRLHLPGALVGGNYDRLEAGAAVWEVKGSALQDREVVLRAVSIVE